MKDRPCRILLVEDDKLDHYIFSRAIAVMNMPCEVILFHNAKEAIEYLLSTELNGSQIPDIIITDMKLPGADGFAVINAASKLPHLKKVPIAAMSSYFDHYDSAQVKKSGASLYFQKPINNNIVQQLAALVFGKA